MHVAHLDKGEAALNGGGGSERGRARAAGTLQQHRQQRGLVAVLHLCCAGRVQGGEHKSSVCVGDRTCACTRARVCVCVNVSVYVCTCAYNARV
jgi:hypothetical protein